MRKELRRALKSAILSAGAWADRFEGTTTIYPPYIPAGMKALRRAGRPDLIPAFIRRTQRCTRWDVASLRDAVTITAEKKMMR